MMYFIIEILLGAFAGAIASKIMGAPRKGFLVNMLLGIFGGFVGGYLGGLLGIGGGWIAGLVLSVAGACLLIFAFRKLSR